MEHDESVAGRWYIYVYDNNYPDDITKKVIIDSATDTWSYEPQYDWGGSWNLYLSEPMKLVHHPPKVLDT